MLGRAEEESAALGMEFLGKCAVTHVSKGKEVTGEGGMMLPSGEMVAETPEKADSQYNTRLHKV